MYGPYRTHPASNASSSGSGKPGAAPATRLELLLRLEGDIRQAGSVDELRYLAVNELRTLCGFAQCFFLDLTGSGRARVTAASAIDGIDRNAPFIRWIEKVAEDHRAGRRTDEVASFAVPADQLANSADGASFPFGQFLWAPLVPPRGEACSALLMCRAKPWREQDIVIAERIGATLAHAIQALAGKRRLAGFIRPRKGLAVVAALALLALIIPVPMTVLAPVEVVADDPVVVASPLDGVIEQVRVEPNSTVHKGDVLFTFERQKLAADAEIAARRQRVAEAKLMSARQRAFTDPRAARQVEIARAEVDLAAAERAYADRLLARARVHARSDGVVIFSDKSTWTARPVSTGERVMEIADPRRVAFRVMLGVSDAIAIRQDARVKIFLDADPLHALEGRAREIGYQARPDATGAMSYRIIVEPAGAAKADPPRIGLRGTAQVYGPSAPLGVYLLRRPIAAFRQFVGW